jgi:alkanesulfonate monooxygenase SsuD/methylene tetrahydromethanopterin reductase-like flavin-dependent oxidoreductase (luciferase family)
MRLGVICSVWSVRTVVDLAVRADEAGLWGLGVADTAPKHHRAAYPTITASLLATTRLRVGATVSNPVSQHWSVHAAVANALDELAPGRFFVGLATGDGAVSSVGLRPASWQVLEDAVANLRAHIPPATEIHVAASGPKGAAIGGVIASDLILGVGLDGPTLRRFGDRARAARAEAGIDEPLRIWGLAVACFVDREEEVEGARHVVRGFANSTARFTFHGTYEDKGVPEEWQGLIRQRFARYDFQHHGRMEENPNSRLFDDHPEVQSFLIDRTLAVGTPAQVGTRLAAVARHAKLDGLWVSIAPTPVEPDPLRNLDRVVEAVAPRLRLVSGG